MYFDSLQAALSMDGHGVFVWSAYGITALVLILILVRPRRRAQQALRRIDGELKRSDGAPSLEGDN